MPTPRVLLLHNRYRVEGGEERSVELHRRALERANIAHAVFERSSAASTRMRAAAAVLNGGDDVAAIAREVRDFAATIVHAHNIQPHIGPRGLAMARRAGARVVVHLHNGRLFCAIGVNSRRGRPCLRCRGRRTLPGLLLNCRRSLPEAAVYAVGLSLHQPTVWKTVDRFVAPSRYAAAHLVSLGVPSERLEVVPHYLPDESLAVCSQADAGTYAAFVGRLSTEKGVDTAIAAAAATRIPLRIAGDGPIADRLVALTERLDAPVEFLGRVDRAAVDRLLGRAAMLLLPSRYPEFAPHAALEAMGRGVPVVATELGGLPELIGDHRCVPANDASVLAARMSALWKSPELRRVEGDALLSVARARYTESRFREALLDLYARLTQPRLLRRSRRRNPGSDARNLGL